jgi:hypothetical protein
MSAPNGRTQIAVAGCDRIVHCGFEGIIGLLLLSFHSSVLDAVLLFAARIDA